MKVVYGDAPLKMDYSDDDLKKIVSQKVESMNQRFGFKSLCAQIFADASNQGHLVMETDTQYYDPSMSPEDGQRISQILWEEIKAGKLFVDFFRSKYDTNPNDYYFCKVK